MTGLAPRRQPIGQPHRGIPLSGGQQRQRVADAEPRTQRKAFIVQRDLRAARRRHEMAGIGDSASTASTAGTTAAVEQPQLIAVPAEHQNVARAGIVDQHPAVVIFEEVLERRRRQSCTPPRRRDAGGSRSAQFGARKAAQRRVRILRHHLVERGRGLLLVDRQVRRQCQDPGRHPSSPAASFPEPSRAKPPPRHRSMAPSASLCSTPVAGS